MSHTSAAFNGCSIAERLYRVLLFAYPAKHRREYGPLLVQLFRDLCRDSYRQKGPLGLIQLWIYVLVDTVVTAAVEHFYGLQEGGQVMTKRQHWTVLSLAGLPLELGVFLFLINPKFISQLFTPNKAQPIGWLMTAAILLLASAAYVVQRRIIVLGKKGFFVGSVLFLVVPALLLVLFGPAIVMILKAGLYP